ncbi:MAG: phosphate ABC transporter permease subunit PstC [Synergistaceae bacterium]|jgi:phosphate transport system permease protein|nr:phosphate ABC transporter permease subunit PstC [Synergistaceae bacterium]
MPNRGETLKLSETAPRAVITVIAMSGILVMAFILYFLTKEGIPILKDASITQLAAGRLWYPVSSPPLFGMMSLIGGSLAVTLTSSVLAIPLGVALALFLTEICPKRISGFFKITLEILGFLPSVVLGFIGMVVIAPYLQIKLELLSGLNLMNASMLLGVMILPTVATLSEESLHAVPQSQRDASYALGATRCETMFNVVLPGAARGIAQAAILGVMRAMGETMVVLMASGGAALLPESAFDPVRPLTSAIAAEMGETSVGSAHYHALFFMGFILLLITLSLNVLVIKIESRGEVK